MTQAYEAKIDQVVDSQFDGDQLLKEAAKELSAIKSARLTRGSHFMSGVVHQFCQKYPANLAYAAGEVLDMANDQF